MSSATADAPLQHGGHATEADRVRLASSAFTPAHVLAGLACDPAVTVRATVAMNPACPPHIDHAISQDADERVRTLLVRKLAPSLAGGEDGQGDGQGDRQARETLAALASDPALRVRAAVADCFKAAPNAPRDLILQLAHNSAPAVCDPVVRWSPLLTDADLLALLATPPHPAIAAAVASRPGLGSAPADAVAAGDDGLAIRALLCNGSAAIGEATLNTLIEQAAPHPDWHGPLVRRLLLTPHATEALSDAAAAQLLDMLARRPDLDPAVAASLRQRMEAGPPPGIAPPAPDSAPDDGPDDVPDDVEEALLSSLRQLDAADALDEATLIDAARAGDLRRVAAVLAVASGLTLAAVDRAAAQRHARALVGLAWKAGFSMRGATVAQATLGQLAPGTLIPAAPDGAFPLTPHEMQWHLDVLAQAAR